MGLEPEHQNYLNDHAGDQVTVHSRKLDGLEPNDDVDNHPKGTQTPASVRRYTRPKDVIPSTPSPGDLEHLVTALEAQAERD